MRKNWAYQSSSDLCLRPDVAFAVRIKHTLHHNPIMHPFWLPPNFHHIVIEHNAKIGFFFLGMTLKVKTCPILNLFIIIKDGGQHFEKNETDSNTMFVTAWPILLSYLFPIASSPWVESLYGFGTIILLRYKKLPGPKVAWSANSFGICNKIHF